VLTARHVLRPWSGRARHCTTLDRRLASKPLRWSISAPPSPLLQSRQGRCTQASYPSDDPLGPFSGAERRTLARVGREASTSSFRCVSFMFGGVKSGHKVPRIVLADDHHFFREGLRDKLEDDGMNVVGDAADGTEAIALAGRLEPDIVVADLSMPGASGIEVVRQVLAKSAEVSVIILTVSADIRSALEALNAGASGYLLKETPVDDIVSTVRLVASGQTVISGGLIPQLLASVGAVERSPASRARQRAGDLTARELEVLKLIAGGADNAAIGRELSISRHTVKRYVTNIFEKLGVGSRVEAAVYAVRAELV